MPAPLLALARAAAAPDGVPLLAIGLDPMPDESGVRGVPVAAAMDLLVAARRREGLDRAAVAAALGLDPDEVGGAALLLPGRRTGWTTVDAAALAVALAGAVRAVVLAAPPSSLLHTPAALAAALRARGGEPAFLGCLPPDDDLAPGCPVAVLESLPDPGPPPIVAAVIAAERPNGLLPHTLRALAEESISAVVVVPPEGGVEAPSNADVEARQPGEAVEAAVARIAAAREADWILTFAAGERPFGPWPELGLRETIARFAASGADAAAATVVLHPPSDPAPDLDPLRLAREWRFATGRADAGRVVLWRRGFNPRDASIAIGRSPWNLLLRRIDDWAGNSGPSPTRGDDGWATADEPGDRIWLPWDDGFGERCLVERLTGHGVFRRSFPTPPDCVMSTEERMTAWRASAFTTKVVRIPAPEPLEPRPGAILLRWEAPGGRTASLFLARPGRPERLIARQPRGTVTVDLLEPNAAYYARLYDDDDRRDLLAEIRFRFAMDLDA